MSENEQQELGSLRDMQVDKDNLYREEVITDLRVVTLRRLVPIKIDGSIDESRAVIYSGETQVLTNSGPLPISGQIEASTLEEAIDRFPEAIQQAMDDMIEEAREHQRQEATRIVVPGGGMPPMPPPGSRGGLQIP